MDYKKKATEIRINVLKMIHAAKSGHPGSSMSVVEILMALYYGRVMHVDPGNPRWDGRDRLVLSKGHASPSLYYVLADMGFFSKDDLMSLRRLHSHLQGHCDVCRTPGVDMTSGSLGQGAAIAAGMALAAKQQGRSYKVYSIIGDGEAQEGIIWEMAMSCAHYKLDNYTLILDNNGFQIDGSNDSVMSLGDIKAKFESFGFNVIKVDGHDVEALINALNAPACGKPKCIIAKTVKGRGVSFMENNPKWHGKLIDDESMAKAMAELEAVL